MEEKKDYGFKFDPNKTEKTISGTEKSKVIIEKDEAPLNMPEGNITLANMPSKFKTRVKKLDTSMGPDIGMHSKGFAGIFTLAIIIALAGAIVAFLAFKY